MMVEDDLGVFQVIAKVLTKPLTSTEGSIKVYDLVIGITPIYVVR